MQAAGETFSVGGSLSLIVLYFRIFENPFWTLVCASENRSVLASIDLVDMCGLWIIAASIFSVDHDGPKFTGQASVDNDCRRGFSRWWRYLAYVHGHMSPSLPIIYLMFSPSGIELSLLMAWFVDIFSCWDVWAKDSAGVVDGCLRLDPFEVWGTDVMCLSGVWNSTCWIFNDYAGSGDDGSMKIGIGVDMGGCLRSSPMITSLSYSSAWAEHDKCEMC